MLGLTNHIPLEMEANCAALLVTFLYFTGDIKIQKPLKARSLYYISLTKVWDDCLPMLDAKSINLFRTICWTPWNVTLYATDVLLMITTSRSFYLTIWNCLSQASFVVVIGHIYHSFLYKIFNLGSILFFMVIIVIISPTTAFFIFVYHPFQFLQVKPLGSAPAKQINYQK